MNNKTPVIFDSREQVEFMLAVQKDIKILSNNNRELKRIIGGLVVSQIFTLLAVVALAVL